MTPSGEYTIVDFEEALLADVLSICKQELGVDYHSEADFKKYLGGGRERFCMVMLDNQKAVCGFTTFLMLNTESADEYLKLPDSPERDRLLSVRKIGISDALAIDNMRKKGGLGRLLLHATYNKLVEEGADVICAMVWKDIHGVKNAGKLFTEIGLEESIAVPGYWNRVVGTPEGHQCPVCKEPPCRCYGVLYIRYLKCKNSGDIIIN